MRLALHRVALSAACGAAAWVACGKPGPPPPRPTETAPRPVRVARAELRPMERLLAVTGTLAAQEASTLSAKVAGRLQHLAVDVGSVVRQGDLIAQIEPRDYELRLQQAAAALAQARAALGLPLDGEEENTDIETVSSVKQAKAVLDEAARNVARVRALQQSSIASASELDTAEAAYKVALTRYDAAREEARVRQAALAQRRAEYELARKQLADSSVRAPFDGAIQARPASVGEYVATGTPIVTLVKTDPLRLRLEVPEREAMLVGQGQTVRLRVESSTNVFLGRIARLSPALDEASRMLLVEADVPNPGTLRPGLFARAHIVVQEREEGVSVPPEALVTFAGIEKVFTVQEGKAVERTVSTGRRGADWVEITSGLEAGAPVILNPGGLRGGQRVTVTGESETAPPTSTGLKLSAGR